MPSRLKIYFAVTVLTIAAAIGIYAAYQGAGRDGAGGSGVALVGGPFTLTDHTGRRVTDKDFHGKFMLVFFGYTYCPDVCPTELQVMAEALDSLGTNADRITPVFVSIDPARDTPEVLESYVAAFSPDLVGLTGTPEEIAAMASAYRVYFAKAGKVETPDYLMDHSSIIYLMDAEGRFLKHFSYTTDAKALAEGLLAATSGTP